MSRSREEEPHTTPESLLGNYFKGGEREKMEKRVLPAAFDLLPRRATEEEKGDVVRWLCLIYNWFGSRQKRPTGEPLPGVDYARWDHIPHAFDILWDYIVWLRDQGWLEEIEPRHFNPDSKVFRRFLSQAQRDVGYDFFDGRSLN
jgi:hypothetical protein